MEMERDRRVVLVRFGGVGVVLGGFYVLGRRKEGEKGNYVYC